MKPKEVFTMLRATDIKSKIVCVVKLVIRKLTGKNQNW